jgi:hypothetical protein
MNKRKKERSWLKAFMLFFTSFAWIVIGTYVLGKMEINGSGIMEFIFAFGIACGAIYFIYEGLESLNLMSSKGDWKG